MGSLFTAPTPLPGTAVPPQLIPTPPWGPGGPIQGPQLTPQEQLQRLAQQQIKDSGSTMDEWNQYMNGGNLPDSSGTRLDYGAWLAKTFPTKYGFTMNGKNYTYGSQPQGSLFTKFDQPTQPTLSGPTSGATQPMPGYNPSLMPTPISGQEGRQALMTPSSNLTISQYQNYLKSIGTPATTAGALNTAYQQYLNGIKQNSSTTQAPPLSPTPILNQTFTLPVAPHYIPNDYVPPPPAGGINTIPKTTPLVGSNMYRRPSMYGLSSLPTNFGLGVGHK